MIDPEVHNRSLELPSFFPTRAIRRDIIRIALPTKLVTAFGFVLQSCIERSNHKSRRRRGSADMFENCMTGMGGQIAVLTWLRHIGIPARMVQPSSSPDQGFDIVCIGDLVKIEVKTSCFQDGRGVDAMQLGDRMPINRRVSPIPDFYFWCVVESFRIDREVMAFDLIATVPAGYIEKWPKPVSSPPGIRLADIPAMFCGPWFVEQFEASLDHNVPPFPRSSDLRPDNVLEWADEHQLLVASPA